jgi:DNA recombination protein RmuC
MDVSNILLIIASLMVVGQIGIIILIIRLPGLLRRLATDQAHKANEQTLTANRDLRIEVQNYLNETSKRLVESVALIGKTQEEKLSNISNRIAEMSKNNQQAIEQLRNTVSEQLEKLQKSNEKRLEEMRQTVDEKLQNTLEKRLGESFKRVSENLEAVQRGLGEMKNLATGVGDLKKVLTNVKDRGTWGELRLSAILEEILAPEQYAINVETIAGSGKRVEFAIKLPGRDSLSAKPVWLPLDSKFPNEDYVRLIDASEFGDKEAVNSARKQLLRSLHIFAKDISEKYVSPPQTTDFAILFLPTEGLYAEVLREPGLIEEMQRKYRIVIAGPTTLAALLNSLQMGFRTLAIEKRSSEVWQVLAAVKTEFGKFGETLRKVKSHLDNATKSIDNTAVRTRAMERQLRQVEELPQQNKQGLLQLNDAEDE